MAFAPVDYGPSVQADTQGVQAAQQATAQHQQVFAEAHNLGNVIQGGAQTITQGILHTQALKATAAVKERQASTLQFIDSNPYVPKAVLQQRMAPDDYAAWHAGLATEYQKAEAVPMFTAAGAMFDSEAKQAREAAGQLIGLAGWRGAWESTERTESAVIRERYVNRMAADQMIADQRAQSIMAIDKVVDGAVKPADLDAAAKMAETNPWLKPAERRVLQEKALAAKDSFVARQAMLAGDSAVMQAELTKLKGPDSVSLYPNMNVNQRLTLEKELAREYGFKAVRDVAEKEIVGPNVSVQGKVDHAGVEKKLAEYQGTNKAEVIKATRAEVAERDNLFHAQMADAQKSITTAGQTISGEFSMARALKDPDARKAAERLRQDAPEMLRDLNKEDQRNINIEARTSMLEKREARQALIDLSGKNLENIHGLLDDPALSAEWKKKTPAQFDSFIYGLDMVESDRAKARLAFKGFMQNGGKPDERPQAAVKAEMNAAAEGDPDRYKKLLKYQDGLLTSAHQFIRDNPDLQRGEMTDALRAHVRAELLAGKVVGSGRVIDSTARRIDWRTNPEFAGKDLKLPDGTIVSAAEQRVHLSNGKQSGWFSAEDAKAARLDGWK